ncbi:MAG: acetyl-CoA carboxylase carboxyl transferase subunit alpha [Micavibrio sp.]|nr:acetyl-CoA carboxylase carboxyl transferase subunit alpha [Micavibrio sp.]|tara:strand:- start:128 stop:1072 length:945 start_codon:yes stop_codon:yes gene_type:complete
MLDFEKPVLELENKIVELRKVSSNDSGMNISEEIDRMQNKIQRLLVSTYSKLTPAQRVKVARHPQRPHFKDYVEQMIEDFTPLAGDRQFGEDEALIGGIGRFEGQSVVIMGHEKGRETNERIRHNFGMARPEGYRKAQRLMRMAEQFDLPIISLVDTAGAYPGLGAEERGQSEAIARSIETCLSVETPFISVIIGEGGSGGAIAIAAADKVFMLEHSVYSVISPEGCASILWRSADYAQDASSALKLTSEDMLKLGLIDDIIKEPMGGAHRQAEKTIKRTQTKILESLRELKALPRDKLLEQREQKFLDMGRNL